MNLIKIILKILISLVLSLGAFIAVAIFINEKLHGDDFWEITGGVIAGLTTLLFCYNYILKRKSFSGTIASGISLLRNTKDAITSDIDQRAPICSPLQKKK